jgi:hypothetical protein
MGTRFHRDPIKAAIEALADFKTEIAERLARPMPLSEGTRNELAPQQLRLSLEARAKWIKFADHIEQRLGQFDAWPRSCLSTRRDSPPS